MVGPETSPARLYLSSMRAKPNLGSFSAFCHDPVSRSDKTRSALRRVLPILTGFVIGLLPVVSFADQGAALEAAAVKAVQLCEDAGADSIEQCGNLSSRTPAASLARRAVIRYMAERDRLIAECGKAGRGDCMHLVEWHTQVGISAALGQTKGYSLSR